MLETYKSAVGGQFEAAYCTLKKLVDLCPDQHWETPVVNGRFCQVVFHALFFSDVYLGLNLKSLREQEFHRQNQAFFADYEELEERPAVMTYGKPEIKAYIEHCRGKAQQVIGEESEATLSATPGFDWLNFSRAEVHVYNLRHLFHHAGQLSMRLRIETGDSVPWIKSGWSD